MQTAGEGPDTDTAGRPRLLAMGATFGDVPFSVIIHGICNTKSYPTPLIARIACYPRGRYGLIKHRGGWLGAGLSFERR
jgi:hypothetical protein